MSALISTAPVERDQMQKLEKNNRLALGFTARRGK